MNKWIDDFGGIIYLLWDFLTDYTSFHMFPVNYMEIMYIGTPTEIHILIQK